MKKIEDYTLGELSAKIEAIKSERERTANALKKYEEELDRPFALCFFRRFWKGL